MSMKLADFIAEEKKRIALFEAYWRAKSEGGEISDGMEVWPDEMESGLWDEMLHTFDMQEATELGLVVEDGPDGQPVVIQISETDAPEP